MPPKQKPATTKRELEDPADVSISRAPAQPKKARAPTGNKPSKTQPNTQSETPPDAPIAAKTRPRAKRKEVAPASDDPASDSPVKPVQPSGRASERSKKLSELAQKVQAQADAKQQVKEQKAKKRAKKDEAAVIEETPEETAAFLASVRKSQPTPTATNVSESTTGKQKNATAPDRRAALSQLVSAHQPSPEPSVVSGLSAASSAISSLAPSESVSQRGGASRNAPKPGTAKQRAASQPTLHVPSPASSLVSSRDISPAAESAVTIDKDEDSGAVFGFEVNKILEDIPVPFKVEIKMPVPLPSPLHNVQVKDELRGVYENTNGKKQKTPKLSELRPIDQQVVKSAIRRMDVLLACACAFPDDETRWILANMANDFACRKHNRNYVLTEDSVYSCVLYDRISQSRAALVKHECSEGLSGYYGLGAGSEPETIAANRDRVETLLHCATFTCPSPEQTHQLYEHPFFEKILRRAYFCTPTSKGLTESDLFKTATLPLIALAATAIEKLLMMYSTGSYQKSNAFSAHVFRPKYYSHLVTLVQMYRSNHPVLSAYLNRLMANLRAPHEKSLIGQISTTIRPSVPMSLINERYATRSMESSQVSASSFARVPAAPATSQRTVSGNNELLSTVSSIVNNEMLSAAVKAQILQLLTSPNQVVSDPNPPLGRRGTSTRASHAASSLLTAIHNGSSDSEVEARRAGAIPSPATRSAMASQVWGEGSEDDTRPEPKSGSKAVGKKVRGSNDDQGDDEEEGEEDADQQEDLGSDEADAADVGDNVDEHMEDAEDTEDAEDVEGEVGSADEADLMQQKKRAERTKATAARSKNPSPNFLSASGELVDPNADSSDASDGESDGNGARGGLHPPRRRAVVGDGDTTMGSVLDV